MTIAVEPKKHFAQYDFLKAWEIAIERVKSDYDTSLSPMSYKLLNTVIVALRKAILELKGYV